MATINIARPRRDNFHGGKFFVTVVLFPAAVYAGFMGWIKVPSASVFGGTFGTLLYLSLIAAVFWGVNVDKVWARYVALAGGMGLAVLAALNWSKWLAAFSDFNATDTAWFIASLVALVAYASWVSYKFK